MPTAAAIAAIWTALNAVKTAITANYTPLLTATKSTLTAFLANTSISSTIPAGDYNDTITSSAANYPTQLDTYLGGGSPGTITTGNYTAVQAFCGASGGLINFYATRFSTILTSYISASSSTNLNKWRTFWINERINQSTGSLTQKNALSTLQTNTVAQIGAITTQNTKLFSVASIIGTSGPPYYYLPQMSMLATYYNPIYNDANTAIVTNKIVVLWDGKTHAMSYTVYKKQITAPLSATSFATAGFTSLTTVSGTAPNTPTTYSDTAISLTNIYAYNVVINDGPDAVFPNTYTSLQSNSLDGNPQSMTVTSSMVSGLLDVTYSTAHGYSAGQLIWIANGSNYYIVKVGTAPTTATLTIPNVDLFSSTIPVTTGMTSQLTYGLAKAGF